MSKQDICIPVSEALLDAYLRSAAKPDESSVCRTLTPREREIVQMLAEGKSNKEIASALYNDFVMADDDPGYNQNLCMTA